MSRKHRSPNAPAPLVLNAPTIVEALDDATGLIPAPVASVGINLRLSTGTASRDTDWMSIEIRDPGAFPPTWSTLVAPYQLTDIPTPIPPIITRSVPAPPPQFRHGFYELRNTQYRNSAGVPGRPVDSSNPGAFRVDTIAPYAVESSREQPTVPVFVNAPPGTVINDAFLVAEGGLEIGIPPNTYPAQPGQFEAGDVFFVYFSPVMDPRPEYLVSDPNGIPMLPTGGSFFLPRDQIILSGMYYLFYTIRDRAGNVSRPSFNDFRTVSLLDDPVPLEVFVPLAPAPRDGSTDDLLDIADYRQGIDVHIEEYLNHAVGLDKFELQWEALPFGPQTPELTGFDVIFTNMNDAIRAAYTATLGPQSVTLRYRIDRNGVFFTSPVKTVRLDLSVEGPTLPGTLEPGDVNPALQLAQVYGAVSNQLNTLRIVDAGQPVRIVIPLWTVAVAPHADNRFFLFWGTAKERVGPFTLSTLVPGDDATFTIPWDVVARHGNEIQPVSYVVTGPGTTNENPSGVTSVDVIDAVTVILPPAGFRYLDVNNEWSCLSLVSRGPGIPPTLFAELIIPADPRLVVGNSVTVTVTIYCEAFGFPPGPFTDDFTYPRLSQDDVDNGFIVEIPYGAFLKQSVFGPCEVTYSTDVAVGVGTGELAEAYTVFSNPASYCDETEIVRP
ncbi:hypothetical protein Q1J45_07625 [Pseudomonas rhodesiae]|uniref:hypothetical protein n=1 Tax=unclassified Pseudomonas TaxID=196821 RepID=UPI002732BDF8|nr:MULTISPECIES: hypothetical protein [unclassified Pseudomonas]WLH43129.1 hypothetical protein PSH94_11340 [Pseudomonas sp. FP2254]